VVEDVDGARVVVGVDGSPGARAALVWAMADAARRGARLQVVSAFPVETYWADPILVDERHLETVRADTEDRVRALVDEVVRQTGQTSLSAEVVVRPGAAAHEVLAVSEGADLLVVGSRGRGSVRSTVLGSVALHAVTHAGCPVVVVHPRADTASTTRRVVVGLDGSDASREALGRAVAEAERLGADLTVVAAYSLRSYWSGAYQAAVPPVERLRDAVRSDAEARVAEVAARGTVGVEVLVVEGAAGDTLVRAAEAAELLVVGSRGRGAVRGVLLGSVALHCVIHAPCPVMVARTGRSA
jgi:nucleotide-binding universal stress UspA family protein